MVDIYIKFTGLQFIISFFFKHKFSARIFTEYRVVIYFLQLRQVRNSVQNHVLVYV